LRVVRGGWIADKSVGAAVPGGGYSPLGFDTVRVAFEVAVADGAGRVRGKS
jgi:hypothetical protein